MTAAAAFTITARWFKPGVGWQTEKTEYPDAGGIDGYLAAGREASRRARELDAALGADTDWNVMLRDAAGRGCVELFHGRLS